MENISVLILKKLRELFGTDPKIYRENVKNGFKEYSFYIPALHVKSTSELGYKHNLTYSCQVIFLPREDHINNDIQAVEDTLLMEFTDLNGNDVYNRDFSVSDNALVFTFDMIGILTEKTESGAIVKKINNKGSELNG